MRRAFFDASTNPDKAKRRLVSARRLKHAKFIREKKRKKLSKKSGANEGGSVSKSVGVQHSNCGRFIFRAPKITRKEVYWSDGIVFCLPRDYRVCAKIAKK